MGVLGILNIFGKQKKIAAIKKDIILFCNLAELQTEENKKPFLDKANYLEKELSLLK